MKYSCCCVVRTVKSVRFVLLILQRLNTYLRLLENVSMRLRELVLQVEPSVAIYNEYLALSFMAMYGAVDLFAKDLI